MTIRSMRYLIDPPGACPPALLDHRGHPQRTCSLDMGDVGLTAMGEVLQTSPTGGNPFFGLFEELLVPGDQRLIWRDDGPGRGVEMRRAFSGLFGRFFARAYLERYHDFTWFVPISRNPTYVNSRLRVRKARSARGDLPDWVCGGPGNRLAIAEAKGSHQKSNPTRGTLPGPITTASTQITGVQLQRRRRRPSGAHQWVNRSVKGWAVMSRWGVEDPAKEPYLFVHDPRTPGESFSDEEIPAVVQSIARLHTRLTLEGLGYFDLLTEGDAAQPVRESRPHQTVVLDIPGEEDRRFLGAVASPLGLLPLSVSESKTLATSLPSLRLFFVGLDLDIVARVREGQSLQRRPTRSMDDGTRVGPDGLMIAPLNKISPDPVSL